MSIAAMTWAWSQSDLDAPKTLLLLALADRADDFGVCWPSQKELAYKSRMSIRSVQRHLNELVEQGYVATVIRSSTSGRKGLLYQLNVGHTIPNPGYCAHANISENVEIPAKRQSVALGMDNPEDAAISAKRQNVALRNSENGNVEIPAKRQSVALPQSDTAVASQSDTAVALHIKNPQYEPPYLTQPDTTAEQSRADVSDGKGREEINHEEKLTVAQAAMIAECLPSVMQTLDAKGALRVASLLEERINAGWHPKQILEILGQAPLPDRIIRMAGLVYSRLESNIIPDQAPSRLRRAAIEQVDVDEHQDSEPIELDELFADDPAKQRVFNQVREEHPHAHLATLVNLTHKRLARSGHDTRQAV